MCRKLKTMTLTQKLMRTKNAQQYVSDWVTKLVGLDKFWGNIKILSAGSGHCLGELKVEEIYTSQHKTLHGGFVATLLDTASTIALNTHEKVDWKRNASVCLNTIHMRPSKIGDIIRVEANTINVGKTLSHVEAVITDSITGKIIAKGTITRYVYPSNGEKDEDTFRKE